jgi:transcriptional regulator with XRE-family HTH domain
VDKTIERLKNEFTSADARYAYAESVSTAFLTAQIKALREDRGLTQEKLAELVGTQQSGISRWLNSGFSTCKVETLQKFAKAYGVRLRISFETFGTLPRDVGGFTKERLAPPKFEDDPAFKERLESEQGMADQDSIWPPNSLQALAMMGRPPVIDSHSTKPVTLREMASMIRELTPSQPNIIDSASASQQRQTNDAAHGDRYNAYQPFKPNGIAGAINPPSNEKAAA